MKEIDFLPQSFYDAWMRRRRNRRNLWFCTALAIALGLLHFSTTARARQAEAALADFQTRTGEHKTERVRVEALHARKQMLERSAALISELDDDAPADAVIGTVTQLMTESMALRGVSLEVQPPATALNGVDAQADPGTIKTTDPVADRGRTTLVLAGVAATDVEVGVFLGRLGTSPLFEDARLMYSRDTEYAGRQMREFELRSLIRRVSVRK